MGNLIGEVQMAKTNYSYEKRQKEIAKKLKQEQKRLKKVVQPGDQRPDDSPPPVATEAVVV